MRSKLLVVALVLGVLVVWRTWKQPNIQPPELLCEVEDQYSCFVYVPPGTFWFGAQASDPSQPGYDPSAQPNEGPPRQVNVNGFWIQKEEQNWENIIEACIRDKACPDAERSSVPFISWYDAQQACAWLGGRLPTEVEWEYAGRGPESRRFPWGDAEPCGLPLSPFSYEGVDWSKLPGCEGGDKVTPDLLGPFSTVDHAWGGAEWVADGDRNDKDGDRRMQKGGSVEAATGDELRLAARWSAPASSRLPWVGFRCAW
jgi:serine/threonine-protein kinase